MIGAQRDAPSVLPTLEMLEPRVLLSGDMSMDISLALDTVNDAVEVEWFPAYPERVSTFEILYYDQQGQLATVQTEQAENRTASVGAVSQQGFHEVQVRAFDADGTEVEISPRELIPHNYVSTEGNFSSAESMSMLAGASVSVLDLSLVSCDSRNFPFVYLSVRATADGQPTADLTSDDFVVTEDGRLQTDFFDVTPPETGGGVRMADIVFLVDTSGSMGGEIAAVRNNVSAFADALDASDVDYRLGLVRFGNSSGANPGIIGSGLTADVSVFRSWVSGLGASGGYEPGFAAIRLAAQSYSFRPASQKVFVLITDEDSDDRNISSTVDLILANDVTVHTAVNSGWGTTYQDYIGSSSVRGVSGGLTFPVTGNYTTILDTIAGQTANTYIVRYRTDNPTLDGQERHVVLTVTKDSASDSVTATYIPGGAPVIERTQQTLDLHGQPLVAGSSPTISAVVTDAAAPFVQSVTLYARIAGSGADYTTINMAHQGGNVYSATLPGSLVHDPGLDYYIRATDGQVSSSDPSVDPETYPYQLAVFPNVAPIIEHTPKLAWLPALSMSLQVRAMDTTNGVREIRLNYRRQGELVWSSQAVTFDEPFPRNVVYPFTIPGEAIVPPAIEYYIDVTDDFGVSTSWPYGGAAAPHLVTIQDTGLAVSATTLSFGKTGTELALEIWNPGAGSLSYTIRNQGGVGSPAVAIAPETGSSAGPHDRVLHTVTIDRARVNAGRYTVDLMVTAGDLSQTVEVEFDKGTIIDTAYRQVEDGFNFRNWGITVPIVNTNIYGRCMGMSYASLYYYWLDFDPETREQWGGTDRPPLWNAQMLYVESLQARHLLDGAVQNIVSRVAHGIFDSTYVENQYSSIKAQIQLGLPSPVLVAGGGGAHALLVWRIAETANEKVMYVYDNNYHQSYNRSVTLSVDNENWEMQTYDLTYSRFGQLVPFYPDDMVLAYVLHSPANLRVTDPQGDVYELGSSSARGVRAYRGDLDNDGSEEEIIAFAAPNAGTYSVEILPFADADPDEEITLEMHSWGRSEVLLDAVKVGDLPEEAIQLVVLAPELIGPAIDGLSLDSVTIDEGDTASLLGAFNDPSPLDGHTVAIDWGDGNMDSVLTSAGERIFSRSHQYLDDEPTDTPSDIYPISVTVSDDTGSDTENTSVTVNNVAPALSSDLPSQTVQYSDPIQPVTISAVDVAADVLTASVTGLPGNLTMTAGSAPRTWIISGKADVAPGTYTAQVTVSDDDGGVSQSNVEIIVAAEDALADYTGAMFACTSSTRSSTATVMLSATVRDITAASPAADPDAGDIRNATVKFMIYDAMTDALVAVIPDCPVGLVSPADAKTGTATYNWTADIGSADSKMYRVVVVVEDHYACVSSPDLITVTKPLDNSVTGGGYLINEASAGYYEGDTGLRTNFGFNIKTQKRGRVQGNVVFLVRRLEDDGIVHTYQIRSNAIQSFSANDGTGEAIFNAKATIQDVTDPLNVVSIDGNASLQITLSDNGEPGTNDTIGITLWNKRGGLHFSSRWDGIDTVEDLLDGGNLQVR